LRHVPPTFPETRSSRRTFVSARPERETRMSSVPQRPRSPFFAFDTETGARRPRWVGLLAGFVALLLAAAGVFAGVGSATAHTPKWWVDCYGVTVKLDAYNSSGANSVKIVVAG